MLRQHDILLAVKAKKAKPARKAAIRLPEPHAAPKILVAMSLVYSSSREFLSGIFRYVDEHAYWDIRVLPDPGNLMSTQMDEVEREGYAGIILATHGDIDFDQLNRSLVPLACWGAPPEIQRRRNVVYMAMDNARHGVIGARHLMARGRYASYGFVRGRFDMPWSRKRQDAFVKTVREAGRPVDCYVLPPGADQWNDRRPLMEWLCALPKPAAVMADHDLRAAQVVAACRDGGLDVPRDVAVLGVDDDAFYVLHTRPPLSSVQPGHAEAGYRIAAELNKLICAKKPILQPQRIVIPPKGVVVRESTQPVSPAVVLVQRAKTFIQANIASGIKVADVAAHLGCSRRIAEMRFRSVQNQTIAAYIADCRLDLVKDRLANSNASVSEIAVECGFKSYTHLAHIFKRRVGMSIRGWRRTFSRRH